MSKETPGYDRGCKTRNHGAKKGTGNSKAIPHFRKTKLKPAGDILPNVWGKSKFPNLKDTP